MSRVSAIVRSTLLLICIHMCIGDYQLEVLLREYRNPAHRLFSGECCDGFANQENGCSYKYNNQCENVFTFCVRPFNSGFATVQNLSDCNQDQITTGPSNFSDDCIFPNYSAGVSNPLVFRGDLWPGAFQFYMGIEDRDYHSSDSEFVDSILVNLELQANNTYTGDENFTGARNTELRVRFRASCATNFSGPNCTGYCGVEGCSPEGAVCGQMGVCECRDGYLGPTCSIEDPCISTLTCLNPNVTQGLTDGAVRRTVSIAVGSAFAGVFLLVIIIIVVLIAVSLYCCARRRRKANRGSYSNLTAEGNQDDVRWSPGDNPTYTGAVGEHIDSSISLHYHFDNTLYGSTSPHFYESLNSVRGRVAVNGPDIDQHYSAPTSPQNTHQQTETEFAEYSIITRENMADDISEASDGEGQVAPNVAEMDSEYSVITRENIGSNSSLADSKDSRPQSAESNAEEQYYEVVNALYMN